MKQSALLGDEPQRQALQGLAARGLRLATAESLTAGLLAARLCDVPGASAVFRGGIVAYCDQVKSDLLAVPPESLVAGGAVSAPVARAMALGACGALGADVALSTTGEAGPESASGKSIGTVFVGLAWQGRADAVELHLPGGRNEVRTATVRVALEILLNRIADAAS